MRAITALGGMHEGTGETTMMGSMPSKARGVFLVESGRYTSNSKSQSRDSKQTRRGLCSSRFGEAIGLGPGSDLL
jgi:hypothetical protein